jgi:hypothetical protein
MAGCSPLVIRGVPSGPQPAVRGHRRSRSEGIERRYVAQRGHSSLGYPGPMQFKAQLALTLKAA